MIFDKQKKPAELFRLSNTVGTETSTFEKVADIEVWIYARSDQEIALHDGNFSKSYSGRVDVDLDIREADRITQSGKTYDVSGVRVHRWKGVASRRLLLEVGGDDQD